MDGEGRLEGVVDREGDRVVVGVGNTEVLPWATPTVGAGLRVEAGVPAMEGAVEGVRPWDDGERVTDTVEQEDRERERDGETVAVPVGARVPAIEGAVLAVAAGEPTIERGPEGDTVTVRVKGGLDRDTEGERVPRFVVGAAVLDRVETLVVGLEERDREGEGEGVAEGWEPTIIGKPNRRIQRSKFMVVCTCVSMDALLWHICRSDKGRK